MQGNFRIWELALLKICHVRTTKYTRSPSTIAVPPCGGKSILPFCIRTQSYDRKQVPTCSLRVIHNATIRGSPSQHTQKNQRVSISHVCWVCRANGLIQRLLLTHLGEGERSSRKLGWEDSDGKGGPAKLHRFCQERPFHLECLRLKVMSILCTLFNAVTSRNKYFQTIVNDDRVTSFSK